jgi:uncharacterized delta-60 repeat protein
MKHKAVGIIASANSRHLRAALILILMTAISVFPFFSSFRVHAAAGDLDSSFGVGGKVVTDVSGYASESGWEIAVQPDGKILVAGFAVSSTNGTSDFAVLRYNPDGSPDTSFGIDGKVFTDFSNSTDQALAIVLQADGRIIVGGLASTSSLPRTFAVVRYLPNGDLDPSFGVGGKTTVIFNRNSKKAGTITHSMVWDIAIQSDGRIVLAGDADAKFGIARLNPDGSLDPNFGVNGTVIVALNGRGTGWSAAYTVAIQTVDSDHRIVAAGYVSTRQGVIDFGLARFRSDGTLDNTFGGDGTVITDFAGGEDSVRDIVIDSSNRIVAAGTCGAVNFALARYNSDGSLDSTFDGDGKASTDFSGLSDEGQAVAIQPDGKIIVAGVARNLPASNLGFAQDFALARYNADGSLDSSFGNNGKLTTDFDGQQDWARALAIQPDNKIVLVGTTVTSVGNSFAIARYLLG